MISSSSSPTTTPSSLGSSSIDYKLIVKGIIYLIIIISLTITTTQSKNKQHLTLMIITILLTMFLLGLIFSFSSVVRSLFNPNQLMLILYIIILMVMFNNIDKDFFTKYAYYIFPFIFIIGIYLFYKSVYDATDIETKFISKDTFKVNVCVLFICLVTFIILLNNELSGYLKSSSSSVITLFILLISIGFLFLLFTLFNDAPLNIIKMQLNSISPGLFSSIAAFFIITFIILFITWFAVNVTSLYNTSNIMAFIVNLILLMAMLGLVYKFVSVTSFYRKSPLLRLIVGVIFYIPCLVYAILEKLYDVIPKISGMSGLFKKPGATTSAAAEASSKHIGMLFFIIFLYLFYFIIYPYLSVKASKQGGLLLVNDPVSIHNEKILASYQNLNQTDHFDYKFGLSFWLYLDSYKPHTNEGSDHYTSVLNYGDKPNILYNPVKNTLRVTKKIDDVDKTDDTTNYLSQKSKYDQNGNVILYEKSGILLQKWNNIIINYNGGTFDIFYNAELVKTHIEIVPYMQYDNLVIGTQNGLYGSICNVNYFKNPISIMQIYYLYNLVKTSTPPVVFGGKVTVFDAKNDYVKIPTTSFETSTIEAGIDSVADTSTQNVEDAVKGLTELNPYQPNYLSLKWYFMGNNDNQTI